MPPQIYMYSIIREDMLRKHKFYCEHIKQRVFSQFLDIEAEADQFAEDEFDRIAESYSYYEDDLSGAAELAQERGYEHYDLLSDLKKTSYLSALAGLYHQWEKSLRKFLQRELNHDFNNAEVEKYIWNKDIGKVFDLLKDYGWDVYSCPFYPAIKICGLIVNVYKHGNGRSFDELKANHPEYLKDGIIDDPTLTALASRFLDHEHLAINEQQFDEFSNALLQFWIDFPERLFLIKR